MPTTFESLPAELVQLILAHALPLPAYSTFSSRYADLRSFSLVHRRWTPLAQALLFAQLHFPSPRAVDAYLTATCAYDEPSGAWMPTARGAFLAELARGAWFGGGGSPVAGSGESARMMVVLVLLVRLRVVWVEGVQPFQLEQLAGLRSQSHLASSSRAHRIQADV